MIKQLTGNIWAFVLLIFLQLAIFSHIQISGFVNPYFYVLYVLLLPFDTPKWMLLITSFFLGFFIDFFAHTPGMHAAACTAMAAFRPTILKNFSPRDGYETGTLPRINYYGLVWFTKYTLLLVFAHHLVLFYCEMFRFSDFFYTLFRAIASTMFSSLLIIVSQYFMFRR